MGANDNYIVLHHHIYINCLVCASVCRGPEMSHTWPEMFQRQVRIVVADCLVCASVCLNPLDLLVARSNNPLICGAYIKGRK
jgi:hypothetical protein